VPAHCGLYNGYLRYHLAIEAPRATPPSLRVKDHHYTRQEGESVLFDDTWSHEIKNESSEIRVVLIVDILRTMRAIAGLVNWAMFLADRFTYALIVQRSP
jgi:aspartyl/asparaginyl beta-hydroxylase (cupin superfamily)